jgi:hypothetical protein
LIIAVGNCLGHTLHVAFLCLHQSAQVLLGRLDHTVVSGLKAIRKWLGESLVNRTQLIG